MKLLFDMSGDAPTWIEPGSRQDLPNDQSGGINVDSSEGERAELRRSL